MGGTETNTSISGRVEIFSVDTGVPHAVMDGYGYGYGYAILFNVCEPLALGAIYYIPGAHQKKQINRMIQR